MEYSFQNTTSSKISLQKGNNSHGEYNQLTIQDTALRNNGSVASVFTRSNYTGVETANLPKVVLITYDYFSRASIYLLLIK